VNDRERHVTALDFKQDIIAVNSSSNCSDLKTMKSVLFWKVRLQSSGEEVRTVRNVRRVHNDTPWFEHLN